MCTKFRSRKRTRKCTRVRLVLQKKLHTLLLSKLDWLHILYARIRWCTRRYPQEGSWTQRRIARSTSTSKYSFQLAIWFLFAFALLCRVSRRANHNKAVWMHVLHIHTIIVAHWFLFVRDFRCKTTQGFSKTRCLVVRNAQISVHHLMIYPKTIS